MESPTNVEVVEASEVQQAKEREEYVGYEGEEYGYDEEARTEGGEEYGYGDHYDSTNPVTGQDDDNTMYGTEGAHESALSSSSSDEDGWEVVQQHKKSGPSSSHVRQEPASSSGHSARRAAPECSGEELERVVASSSISSSSGHSSSTRNKRLWRGSTPPHDRPHVDSCGHVVHRNAMKPPYKPSDPRVRLQRLEDARKAVLMSPALQRQLENPTYEDGNPERLRPLYEKALASGNRVVDDPYEEELDEQLNENLQEEEAVGNVRRILGMYVLDESSSEDESYLRQTDRLRAREALYGDLVNHKNFTTGGSSSSTDRPGTAREDQHDRFRSVSSSKRRSTPFADKGPARRQHRHHFHRPRREMEQEESVGVVPEQEESRIASGRRNGAVPPPSSSSDAAVYFVEGAGHGMPPPPKKDIAERGHSANVRAAIDDMEAQDEAGHRHKIGAMRKEGNAFMRKKNLELYTRVVEENEARAYLENLRMRREERRRVLIHQRILRDREVWGPHRRVAELWDILRGHVRGDRGGNFFFKMAKLVMQAAQKVKKHKGIVASQLDEMFERTFGFTFYFDSDTGCLMVLHAEEGSIARYSHMLAFEKLRTYQDMRIASKYPQQAVWNVILGVNIWQEGALLHEMAQAAEAQPRRRGPTREEILASRGQDTEIVREYEDEDAEHFWGEMEEERQEQERKERLQTAMEKDWKHNLYIIYLIILFVYQILSYAILHLLFDVRPYTRLEQLLKLWSIGTSRHVIRSSVRLWIVKRSYREEGVSSFFHASFY